MKFSKDGKFLAAVGVYPPQVKVYELEQLSMKFERSAHCKTTHILVFPVQNMKCACVL